MHRLLLSPSATMVAVWLAAQDATTVVVDDRQLALELGLARKTISVALHQLARLGAVTITPLPPGPRQRKAGPPTRTVTLDEEAWLWSALRGGGR